MAVDRYRLAHDGIASAVGSSGSSIYQSEKNLMKFVVLLLSILPGLLVGGEIKALTVEYAKVAGKSLKLDFYQPDDLSTLRPLIVWVHGGAWRAGSRKSMPIKGLLKKGFALASVDYRLTPVAPYPANVHDIKAAIRFLRTHAVKYRINDEKISIAGVSAGGHLAALVGLTNRSAKHEGVVGDFRKVSSKVQAVVSFYGASDLLSILGQSTPHGLSVRVPALNLLLGGSPKEKLQLARLASPLHQLDSKDPRVLLIHGDQDPQMPYQQSKDLYAACLKLEIPCELVTVKGGKHGGREFYEESVLTKITGFLSKAN
ncbi:alpha/beta hydrolase [bacterium]|nr:alpha/beta hydrolase [bacterium]